MLLTVLEASSFSVLTFLLLLKHLPHAAASDAAGGTGQGGGGKGLGCVAAR